MKKKIKGKSEKLSTPFDLSVHKTERSAVAVLMTWMREIIEEEQLDLGPPDVETSAADRKMPDVVIYESPRSNKVLCLIEAKPPHFDVFGDKELKEPARNKATERKARYFATTNFKRLIWFSTERVNALASEEEQVVEKYLLSEVEDLDSIEETRYKEGIKKELKKFLIKLYAVYTKREPEPKQSIDEFLVFRLQEKIHTLAKYYRDIIEDQCNKDEAFADDLKKWFIEQGWSFSWEPHNYETAARQTAYLLVNKILFYNLLQTKRPKELQPLEIPESFHLGVFIGRFLQLYFDEVLKIDYETIYTTDFIDKIAFPEGREVVEEIKKLVSIFHRYDFSKLGYDIIGRIFERLIPPDERHYLGQYFTNPDVVDIILKFCMHHEDDKIIDPSCGAGTFLVRAYQHKKLMNQYKSHEEILERLWGNDIAKFPAHLATINLAINNLGVDKNYPNIIQEDFFELLAKNEGFELPKRWRKARAKTLGVENRDVHYPRWFDAVVGNPPYTRQEEISQISPSEAEYKSDLYKRALLDINGENRLADIGKRAGIHAYFFVHGTKFLADGGYFGFIVSNSWLDVDYGKGLQEFFLKNYKIIAIIESKIERWFEEADINTCIVILQKCKEEKERDEYHARFVQLKKPLRYFIPEAQDIWEKQVIRMEEIDKLIKTILAHHEYYENEDIRVSPKMQKELWEEGYDDEENKFTGAKWGKYIRAPKIFFNILEKGKDKFVPLKEIADVRFGIKTGVNKFFYLTEEEIKRRGIEKEYLEQIIFSLKEVKGYVVNKSALKYKVLICHKNKRNLKGKNLLKYIREGEQKDYHKRPTCSSRGIWYSLGKDWDYAPLIFPAKVGERMPVFLNSNVFEDKKLYGVTPKKGIDKIILAALLNSTISRLFIEYSCRQLTGAQAIADIDVKVVEDLNIFNPLDLSEEIKNRLMEKFNKLSNTKCESILKELGAFKEEAVSLENVKQERRELDKIILEEILGLDDDEQLEVYRAVIDFVHSRIIKAKSVENNKLRGGINITQLLQTMKDKLGDNTLGRYYRENVLSEKLLIEKEFSGFKGTVSVGKDLFGWKLYIGKESVECRSADEAKYCNIFLDAYCNSIKIPENDMHLKEILPEIETLKEQGDKVIKFYLEAINNPKQKEQITQRFWSEIMQQK